MVDVEGDQGAAVAGGGEVVEEGQAVGGEGGGDAGQVQDAGVEEVLVRHVVRGHRGGGGACPVVGDLVGVGGPVRRRAEVDAGGAARVAADGGGVDAVAGDRVDEVVAEAVGAHPADPFRPVARRGERAGDVGLGTTDAPAEGGDVGEAARLRGQERHHGLAEADDVRGGCPGCGSGHSGLLVVGRRGPVVTIDPASARMLDSLERYTQRLLHRMQRLLPPRRSPWPPSSPPNSP